MKIHGDNSFFEGFYLGITAGASKRAICEFCKVRIRGVGRIFWEGICRPPNYHYCRYSQICHINQINSGYPKMFLSVSFNYVVMKFN